MPAVHTPDGHDAVAVNARRAPQSRIAVVCGRLQHSAARAVKLIFLQAVVIDAQFVVTENFSERLILRFFFRRQRAEKFLPLVAHLDAHLARLGDGHLAFGGLHHGGLSQPAGERLIHFLDARVAVIQR